MCGTGPQGLWSDMPQPPQPAGPSRLLKRNVSTSSSNAANNAAAAVAAALCDAEGGLAPAAAPAAAAGAAVPAPAAGAWPEPECRQADGRCGPGGCGGGALLLGTSAGLFLLDLESRELRLLGLREAAVAHVACRDGVVLASCPVPEGDAGAGGAQCQAAAGAAGLYALRLAGGEGGACAGACAAEQGGEPCSMFADGEGGAPAITKLWDGNARCSAFGAPAAGAGAPPRLYLGAQPAAVLCSDDCGGSWANIGLGGAPGASAWYNRQPPYEPSVRSINTGWGAAAPAAQRNRGSCSDSSSNGGGAAAAAAAAAAEQQGEQQEQLMVGVEVGGALVCALPQADAVAAAEGGPCSLPSWSESSQGLCRDIQALQQDPFSSKLFAVAGSGSLPGGVYRSRGMGQKWKRLFGYRYSVGLAVSPFQKGRLVLVSADKPPAIGCSLFESVDGGRRWANVTDDVYDSLNALTGFAPGLFDQAPVAMFAPGGLLLACATGHLFLGAALPGGGYGGWAQLAQLPVAINCLSLADGSVAPVAVSRGF